MKNLLLVFLTLTTISFSSCSVNKRLAPYTSALEKLSVSNVSGEEKLEVLAVTTTRALRESLVFANPKKTGQFVDKFVKQNEKSIGKILSSLEGDVSKMNLIEKVGFFTNTSKKPYIKELKTEAKAVEKRVGRKMKTFGMLGKVFGFLSPLKK